MKLWQKYIHERLGGKCLESEHAFITFAEHKNDGIIIILDAFVDPDYRGEMRGMHLYFGLERYAVEHKFTEIQGTLHLDAPEFVRILRLALNQNYKVVKAHNNAIHVSKKVGV